MFRRGIVARHLADLYASVGLSAPSAVGFTPEMATEMATVARQQAGATHVLAVLVDVDEGPDRNDLGGTICLAVATAQGVATRRSRIAGGANGCAWVPSRWGWIACAVTCWDYRSTSTSTSSAPRKSHRGCAVRMQRLERDTEDGHDCTHLELASSL